MTLIEKEKLDLDDIKEKMGKIYYKSSSRFEFCQSMHNLINFIKLPPFSINYWKYEDDPLSESFFNKEDALNEINRLLKDEECKFINLKEITEDGEKTLCTIYKY